MNVLKLVCGIVFLFIGFIYLYKPKLVVRINFYAKEFLFNDAYVLLRRKKIGVFFILLSVIAFYMAWTMLVR